MNNLCLIVTSFLEYENEVIRLFDSLGESNQITVIFINQSNKDHTTLFNKYRKRFNLIEIKSDCRISLSAARNMALRYLYSDSTMDEKTFILFTDDDAWYPVDTIKYLLSCENKAYSLMVYDPFLGKSFLPYQNRKQGIIKKERIITDIISISIVVPFGYLKRDSLFFNEKLGLGNLISQGEETFLCFQLYENGCNFFRSDYSIYHPYKKTFNEKNFYSFAYFLSSFTQYISPIFKTYLLFFLMKYSFAIILGIFKDKRYFKLAKKIYKGYFDGKKDIYSIFK